MYERMCVCVCESKGWGTLYLDVGGEKEGEGMIVDSNIDRR